MNYWHLLVAKGGSRKFIHGYSHWYVAHDLINNIVPMCMQAALIKPSGYNKEKDMKARRGILGKRRVQRERKGDKRGNRG